MTTILLYRDSFYSALLMVSKENSIRAIVKASVQSFAQGFSDRHISEFENPDGTINMKIHNVFIAKL